MLTPVRLFPLEADGTADRCGSHPARHCSQLLVFAPAIERTQRPFALAISPPGWKEAFGFRRCSDDGLAETIGIMAFGRR